MREIQQSEKNMADVQLDATSATLPGELQSAQEKLGALLRSAQELSLERYALADKMSTLIAELNPSSDTDKSSGSDVETDEGQGTSRREKSRSVMEQMEAMQAELQHLEAGLLWISVLEQVLVLRYVAFDPNTISVCCAGKSRADT